MKLKLVTTLLMSSTLLFSNSIVGAWTIDKEKGEQLLKDHAHNEMEQFVISMMAMAMADIEFKEDGSCQLDTKNRTKCWEKVSDNHYRLYEEDGSDKGVKVKVIDEKSMELMMNKPKLNFTFNRVDASSMVAPKIVMKKDRVYHAKNIEMKEFHIKGSGYLLFTGEHKFYHLSTEKLNSLTLEELKEIKAKDERNEGGFLIKKGAYAVNKGEYSVKNNAFYTSIDPFTEEFSEKKIEVISPKQILFNGYNYYLEE